MVNVSTIVAIDKNGGIGKDNTIPWRLSKDMKTFKKLTKGSCVVMGRKTYESIGKPLPNRVNIVLSRSLDLTYEESGVYIVRNVSEALDVAKNNNKDLFVCGGSEVYKSFMPIANRLYITMVFGDCGCDTNFVYNHDQVRKGEILGFTLKEVIFKQSSDEKNEYNSSMILFERSDI